MTRSEPEPRLFRRSWRRNNWRSQHISILHLPTSIILARGLTVAETVVALALAPKRRVRAAVPDDRELVSAAADLFFSTITPVTVQPGGIARMFTGDRQIYRADTAAAAAVLDAPVAVLGPQGSDPLIITFTKRMLGKVSFYLWTGAPDHDDDVRRRLQAEAADVASDRKAQRTCCPSSRFDDWRRHHEVDVAWEVYTQKGWTPAVQVDDQTRALTLSGFVRLRVDATLVPWPAGAAPAVYAVRVKLVRGEYEAPPMLKGVLLNAVGARHQSRKFSIRLESSDGRAGQTRRVPRSAEVPVPGLPLVFDGTEVTVTPRGRLPEEWTVAVDRDRAGPETMIIVLDADTAELQFGDGRSGRVPPDGASIEIRSRVGGGPGGNVPADTLKRVRVDDATVEVSVVQPFAARGGGPAPSIADLQVRVLADLARPTRATTLADFERLALETPGLPSGRAYAIADHHPDFPGLPARGCVTVVVVPHGTGTSPKPTPGFLKAVRMYLGRRRPVTTEVHVIAPTYTKVAVRARLHLAPYADAPAIGAEASKRLDAFFHPLTGGPDGGGWPVGRDVYRSEVMALLQEIVGVHHVDELSLLVGPDRAPRCHNVSVCPTDLVATTAHELTVAPARIR
jgi:hypothetical protein